MGVKELWYKPRLVEKVFTQVKRMYYNDIFSPTLKT